MGKAIEASKDVKTQWDKAVETFEQRKLAIAAWQVEKNKMMSAAKGSKAFHAVVKKFDVLFEIILKDYPIKTSDDYFAIDRNAGLAGYGNGKKTDQIAAGMKSKPDALQKLILGMVKENPKLSLSELTQSLEDEIGMGTIEDVSDDVISFADDGKPISDSPISGLKDRLSRAKKSISKENKSR